MQSSVIKHTVLIGFVVWILDYFANKFYFYWTVSWFDIMMHFLAGFWISFVVALFWKNFSQKPITFGRKFFVVSFLVSLIIGLCWEYYELYFGLASLEDGLVYYRDTISDLFLDVLGAGFSAVYITKILSKKSNE